MFAAIVLLAFFITKPFLQAVLTGSVIAYLSYPLYEKTLRHIRNKNLASLIVSTLIVLLLTVPFIIVITLVSQEAYYTYTTLNQQNLGTNFLKVVCRDEEWYSCRAARLFVEFLPQNDLDYYLKVTVKKITSFIIENFSKFLVSIPSIFLNFFVMIFVVYYLLKDGAVIAKKIKSIIPLKELHKQKVLDRFHNVTYAVFYGNILIAILQGIFGIIGFLIFKILFLKIDID